MNCIAWEAREMKRDFDNRWIAWEIIKRIIVNSYI